MTTLAYIVGACLAGTVLSLALARLRLASAGVTSIYGGGFCTRDEPDRFFSYRREPKSGRMGAFIWIE